MMCGGIFSDSIITNVSWFWKWISLKICQYLTKLRRTKQKYPSVLDLPVFYSCQIDLAAKVERNDYDVE